MRNATREPSMEKVTALLDQAAWDWIQLHNPEGDQTPDREAFLRLAEQVFDQSFVFIED